MSTEPLKEYFECLHMFSSGVFERVDNESGIDLIKVNQLIEQGCLAATEFKGLSGNVFFNVSITPRGAIAISEWSMLLSRNTAKGQLIESFGKIVWLIAGMFITVFGSLLLKVLE